MKIKIKEMVCNNHPKYQGKRRPTSGCLACHALYALKKFGKAWLSDYASIIVRS